MAKKPTSPSSGESRTWNGEMVTAWVSIVIALAALGLTVYEGREERTANRIAVMPYMSVYADVSPELDEGGLFVHNIGLGPAIVLDRFMRVEGQPYRREQGVSFAAFSHINEPWKLGDIMPGSSIAAGSRVMVLGFATKDMSPERRKMLIEFLAQKVQYEIKFASFYGEVWTASTSTTTLRSGERRMNLHRSEGTK